MHLNYLMLFKDKVSHRRLHANAYGILSHQFVSFGIFVHISCSLLANVLLVVSAICFM